MGFLAQGLFGIAVLTAIAWILSEDRKAVAWRTVAAGLGIQFLLTAVLLNVEAAQAAFRILNDGVIAVSDATRAGTAFVFGYIGGGEIPFMMRDGAASTFVLAFESLPLILVISALAALLFHWNIIQPVVRGFAWALRKSMGVNGPVGVSVTMNIFVGMTEAPLIVRPYLSRQSRSSLFVIMTAGMSTVAGTVMLLYASFLQDVITNPLGHILMASLISAPAAIMISMIMIPEQTRREANDDESVELPGDSEENAMSVLTRGTLDGVKLVINIIAMLIVLVALVTLANKVIGLLPDVGGTPLTAQRVAGWAMTPFAWLIGIPWDQAIAAGQLLGTKVILNELIAYIELASLDPTALDPRSRIILTYALCGFANLSSVGILIGGLVTMVPDRRSDIVALAPRAVVSGTLATLLTGAMVGIWVP